MKRLESVAVPQPAPGTDFEYQPGYLDAFKVVGFTARFVTSAVVASRYNTFQLTDVSGNVIYAIGNPTAIDANTTALYAGASSGSFTANNIVWQPLAVIGTWPELWVPPLARFGSLTPGISAGDQWSNVYLLCEVGDWAEDQRALERAVAAMAAAAS